jgi:hypothetical protein
MTLSVLPAFRDPLKIIFGMQRLEVISIFR